MTILERMARAHWESRYTASIINPALGMRQVYDWTALSEERKARECECAKAALECLLEPTEGMADAGWESKPLVDQQYGAEDACVIFQAMIRAALDERP